MKQCPKCGKYKLGVKAGFRKTDGMYTRTEICYAIGCGYRKDLTPWVPSCAEVKRRKEVKQGQMTFNI